MSFFGWREFGAACRNVRRRLSRAQGRLTMLLGLALVAGLFASPVRAADDEKSEAQKAREALMQIFGLDAKHKGPDVQFLQNARDKLMNGDGDGAFAELEKARDKNKTLAPPRVLFARMLFAVNRQEVVNLAKQALERAAVDDADQPEVYILLGNVGLSEGRLADAQLEYLHSAELVTPKFADARSPDAQRLMRQIYAGLTSVAEQRQEWLKAVQMASLWIENSKDDNASLAQAKQRLGRAMFFRDIDSNDPKAEADVLKVLEEAHTADSNLEYPLVTMGSLATQMASMVRGDRTDKYSRDADDYDKMAARFMDQAVNTAKSDTKLTDKVKAAIFAAVSQWYLNQGQQHIDKAAELAAQAYKADSDSDAMKRLTGLLKLLQHDYTGAAAEFESLYQKNPAEFFASNNLVLALIEGSDEGKWDRALSLAEINARQFPRSPEALATVGWVYFKRGRLQEAAQVLQAAVSNGQASLDTAFYLASVLRKTGQLTEAGRVLRQALSSNGPFMHRKEAEKMAADLGIEIPKSPATGSEKEEKETKPKASSSGSSSDGNAEKKPNP